MPPLRPNWAYHRRRSLSFIRLLPVYLCAFAIAAFEGCDHEGTAPLEKLSSETGGVEENATFLGFSWVREGKLAGMPRPGGSTDLQDDLAFLRREGLQVLISLTEKSTSPEAADKYGMKLIHVPVKDFTAPSQQQLLDFIIVTESAMDEDKAVGVHCAGGHGRTGTFLAAWFIHEGMTADTALDEIRRLRPGSVETESQEQALRALESYLVSGEVKIAPSRESSEAQGAAPIQP